MGECASYGVCDWKIILRKRLQISLDRGSAKQILDDMHKLPIDYRKFIFLRKLMKLMEKQLEKAEYPTYGGGR